jgi:hypothetical protein
VIFYPFADSPYMPTPGPFDLRSRADEVKQGHRATLSACLNLNVVRLPQPSSLKKEG